MKKDLCKTPIFARLLCQAQSLILKILNVFMWLKFLPALNSNKNIHFSKVLTILESHHVHFAGRKGVRSLTYSVNTLNPPSLNAKIARSLSSKPTLITN